MKRGSAMSNEETWLRGREVMMAAAAPSARRRDRRRQPSQSPDIRMVRPKAAMFANPASLRRLDPEKAGERHQHGEEGGPHQELVA